MDEHALYGNLLRLVLLYQGHHCGIDVSQALRQGAGRRLYASGCDIALHRPVAIDQAVAGTHRTRIDAQHAAAGLRQGLGGRRAGVGNTRTLGIGIKTAP